MFKENKIDKIIINKNTLINGDFFNVLPFLEDKSIDIVCADLPYGTTKCKWDTPIDLFKMWEQLNRVIKDRGVILLFGQTPFDKVLGASNLKMLKYEWIWEKTQATGFFNAKKMPMKAHENILVFYKKTPKYFPQKTEGHKPMNYYTKKAEVQNKTQVYGHVRVDVSGGGDTDRYPRSIQVFSSDKQKNKLNGTIHPTQKPLSLVKYLLESYAEPESVVLDMCMGSNTTGLACDELSLTYIGIEKDTKWFDVSVKRVTK